MIAKNFLKAAALIILIIIIFVGYSADFDFWQIRRSFEVIKYEDYIFEYAEKYSIEAELLAAIIYVESRFDTQSESFRGALGLMQIMPSTGVWIAEQVGVDDFSIEDLLDPELNIKFGSWYFAYLYERHDRHLVKTLAAYNAGQNTVRRWVRNGWQGEIDNHQIPFAETDKYVRRVISTKDYYKKSNIFINF
ncbi:lytic transglycosylase domain-containing protein [Halanaerobium hydrogeniformans]|uniref:Lytic transglycosylase catalytic n=1 Tax=Halanaerobium hydrogeniformans TaxID=656519 RepID=E4RIU7_HALHG|nr:lytic transglycosylase domain-containing protein [Halanaerobium hydrogeniformans]ADQ15167.1 Lytic transglycosylase catalytic [Halanaerobium hydrogeniformans]